MAKRIKGCFAKRNIDEQVNASPLLKMMYKLFESKSTKYKEILSAVVHAINQRRSVVPSSVRSTTENGITS